MTEVPRFWRMYLLLWLIKRCRLPATPAFTLPVAVNLKRFLAPDFVFSFGIFTLCIERAIACRLLEPPGIALIENRPGMPVRPAVRYAKARLLVEATPESKRRPSAAGCAPRGIRWSRSASGGGWRGRSCGDPRRRGRPVRHPCPRRAWPAP